MYCQNKNNDKMLVPWFNKAEWLYVNDLIYSHDEDKKQALEIIKLWKMRVPKLPSGIEGTLIILDAILQDTEIMSDENLCLLYGTSIMRFLNLCGAYTNKQESFYKTAKRNKLPDWLIDLRNDLAHEQKVPSKYMLRLGLEYCLDWLKKAYWDEQGIIMEDHVVFSKQLISKIEFRLVVSVYSKLNDLNYVSPQINTVEKIVNSGDEIRSELETLCDAENISHNSNINYVQKILFEKFFVKEKLDSHIEVFLDTLFTESPPITFLGLSEVLENDQRLSIESLKRWKDLINLMYNQNQLLPIIKKLIQYSHDTQNDKKFRLGASLWLKEIFEALKKAKEEISQTGFNHKEYQGRFEGFNFNPFDSTLVEKLKPLQQDLLSNPTEFSIIFVKLFLELCEYPHQFINDSMTAIKSFLIEKKDVWQSPLHMIEEFKGQLNDDIINSFSEDFAEPNPEDVEIPINETNQKWTLVKDVSIFEKCPLGVLSHQNRKFNPLLVNVSQ